MAKKDKNLTQEKIEFIVSVWSSDFHDRAPSSRNYLYDYIKSKHPDFTCGSDVLREAQKILKDAVKTSKGNFDSISPILVLDAKVHQFAMELREQFISEAMQLRQDEIYVLKNELQLLKKELEFHKDMEKHYENQCALKDLENSRLLKELNALKETYANKEADDNNDSVIVNNIEELPQTSELVTEPKDYVKASLEAVNTPKVKLGKEEPNDNLSPPASTNEAKTESTLSSNYEDELINELSLLVEDSDEPTEPFD